MQIPNEVLDVLLADFARSDLECENEPEIEKVDKPAPPIKREKRPRKFTTILSSPTTTLFSREGKYRANVSAIFDTESDGYNFKVDVTGRIYDSQKLAIKNASRWLKKKRMRYYKKHPKERVRFKTVRINPKIEKIKNPIKTINKLYKMEKSVARILYRMSGKKLKVHGDYSRKKWDNKKTTAVSGDTEQFNTAIYNVMKDGTKTERKLVAKMLKKFTHEPFRKTNLFY